MKEEEEEGGKRLNNFFQFSVWFIKEKSGLRLKPFEMACFVLRMSE